MSYTNKYYPAYKKLYPGVEITPEILAVLRASDRQMRRFEEELKAEGFESDNKKQTARFIYDLRTARNGSLLWGEDIVELNKQISDIASQERLLTQLKQQGVVDPDIFISRSNLLAERRRELKLKKERILCAEEDHTIQRTQELMDVLESSPDWLEALDEELFSELIEKIVIEDNEILRFRLINGLEVTEPIERTKR